MKRRCFKIFLMVLVVGCVFASTVFASDHSLVGGQDPNVTLGQIFDPIERFITSIGGFIETIIMHLFDWNWIRGIFTGLFGAIDGWIENITGNNLGEIFRIIGHTLSEAFYFIVDLIKNLWPF